MQKNINHSNEQGEVIAFYGDLTSINPEDVAFRGSATEPKTVLAYVKEHQNNPHFTMMYSQEDKGKLFLGLHTQIMEINPDTQFMQINSIEEFATYYDKGNREMDRELHPVESVKMLARPDTLFYDVKERKEPVMEENQITTIQHVKLSEIGYLGVGNELSRIAEDIRAWDNDEFIHKTGFRGNEEDIEYIKYSLDDQIRRIAFANTGKAVLDTISMPSKKVTDLVKGTIEKVYNLAKDKDVNLEPEFTCDENTCHISGFNLIEKSNEKVDISDSHHVEKIENITEYTNTSDSIAAAKAFVEDLNLSTDNSDNNDQGYGIGD